MKNATMTQNANAIIAQVTAQVCDTMQAEKVDMFEKLADTEQKIINAVTKSTSPPAPQPSLETSPLKQTINVATNDMVTMEILKLLKELQQDMRSSKKRPPSSPSIKQPKPNNTKKKFRRTDISKYCWSCGAWNHTSN